LITIKSLLIAVVGIQKAYVCFAGHGWHVLIVERDYKEE